MSRRSALDSVSLVMEERERTAARELGEKRRRLNEQEARLTELRNHRTHYQRELLAAGSRALAMVQLREYQRFLHRLDQAILQQEQLVARSHREWQQSQLVWLERRKDVKAIGKLTDRRALASDYLRRRKEQAENDDRACQRPGTGPFD